MAEDRRDRIGRQFTELAEIMARLRGPQGCPWDREQDHRSLRPCLLEEAYEVLEAVDAGDMAALRQELGDLLMQVIFHAQLAAEAGQFAIEDVLGALRDKLVTRHPHIFGDKALETAEAVVQQWEAIKAKEGGPGPREPKALPALARAQKLLRRLGREHRGLSAAEAKAALERVLRRLEAASGVEAEAAVGDLLLAAVDVARLHGVEAEQALRERVDRLSAEMNERRRESAASPDVVQAPGKPAERRGRSAMT